MKKTYISKFAIFALSAIMLFASCKKEESSILQFTGTMEGCNGIQGKTSFVSSTNGYTVQWASGDEIMIYDESNNSGTFVATPTSSDPTVATITSAGDNTLNTDDSYTAIYPDDYASSSTTITLPIEQECDANGFPQGFPMYATTDNTTLRFRNLCGLLRLNLQKTGTTLAAIYFGANTPINGDFTIGGTSTSPTLTAAGNNGYIITLRMPENGISINTAHDFYIYLPANDYNGFTITLKTTDGAYSTYKASAHTSTSKALLPIERSKYTEIRLGDEDIEILPLGALPGLFTVSNSSSTQVHFSKGNLQYQASTGTWRFAEHQYDFVGGPARSDGYPGGNVYHNNQKCNNTLILSTGYEGWIDLFGWSASTENGANNAPYGVSASTSAEDYAGSFYDWGHVDISNDGYTGSEATNKWHTLSQSEFETAFYGTTYNIRITESDGDFIWGRVKLPVIWNGPTFNTGNGMIANTLTESQWEQIEAIGALYLPRAGKRNGTTYTFSSSDYNGYYWTTSQYNGSIVAFKLAYNGTSNAYHTRYTGQSVRLVLGAPTSTPSSK